MLIQNPTGQAVQHTTSHPLSAIQPQGVPSAIVGQQALPEMSRGEYYEERLHPHLLTACSNEDCIGEFPTSQPNDQYTAPGARLSLVSGHLR